MAAPHRPTEAAPGGGHLFGVERSQEDAAGDGRDERGGQAQGDQRDRRPGRLIAADIAPSLLRHVRNVEKLLRRRSASSAATEGPGRPPGPEPVSLAVVTSLDHIRNFSIIAHIDHGKSTLADRILESTGTVATRDMKEQLLDKMDLERERGITIKSQAVRIAYKAHDGQAYQLNLIDTPGHVDFTYEVSRSLAACEGAVLLVDSTQGVEAQTVANAYLAIDNDLEIIPVLNKIDLPASNVPEAEMELHELTGATHDEILTVSAKTGEGVDAILDAIVTRTPPPEGDPAAPPRALIFDSEYDQYRGVIAYVRVIDGGFSKRQLVRLMRTDQEAEIEELGYFGPEMKATDRLETGEVGYIITGVKDVAQVRVGDTITDKKRPAGEALPGYKVVQPMVFTGLFPTEGDKFEELRDALEKLKLNDAALTYEPESSVALGFGFRCGFLGLLHMDIVRERLEREYDLELITTMPNVEYHAYLTNGKMTVVRNPAQMPDANYIDHVEEPYVSASVLVPTEFVGTIMELCQGRRADFVDMKYLSPNASRCTTSCRWARSCSTSSTSSRRVRAATRRSTTSTPATAGATSSSSTCCSPASPWTRCR